MKWTTIRISLKKKAKQDPRPRMLAGLTNLAGAGSDNTPWQQCHLPKLKENKWSTNPTLIPKMYRIWGLSPNCSFCSWGSQVRAVHTTSYDSKELWRHRTYLDYLGFLFIREEFGVQLSGFPGTPGELSRAYILGK